MITVVATIAVANTYWQQRPDAWSAETQVTNDPGDSRLVDLCADPSGHTVYLVWENNRGGQEVYFQRSLDDGVSWDPELRLSNLTSVTPEPEPRLATNGGQVLVFFANRTGTGEHLYYAVSDDWGSDFSGPLQLTHDSGDQSNVAAAIVASTVHVVWQENFDGELRIFYAKSVDSGQTWQPEVALTNVTVSQDQFPAISAVGDKVFVTWSRMYEDTEAIYAKASLDSGNTWQPEVQVSNFSEESYPDFPAIASNGTYAHLIWGSSTGIQYSRSSNLGETWSSPIPLTNASRQYVAPRIAVSDSEIQVVTAGLSLGTQGTSDVFYLDSSDGGETWNAPLLLTAHEPAVLSLAPVVSSNGDGTFVAWEDNRNGHFTIFLRTRPDFVLLRNFEWQLFTPLLIILAAAASFYLGFELREWKLCVHRKSKEKKPHLRTRRRRRTKGRKSR